MIPRISGKIKTNNSFDDLVKIMLDNFKSGKKLVLENENELKKGRFTLKKKNKIFNPFDIKLIMGEIRGQIIENEIEFKIEMSNLMKFIFWFDMIILIILSILFFSNKEYETGFVILGFIILASVITYFWFKIELKYLENRFEEDMKYV
ncbi:MAG: hypothetical protein AAGK97_00855 [Bacteroidota bacterium]